MTEEKEGDGSLPLGASNQDDVKVDNWHLSSYHEHLIVIFLPDRPACLITTLSLGFASDSLFTKPNQNNQK